MNFYHTTQELLRQRQPQLPVQLEIACVQVCGGPELLGLDFDLTLLARLRHEAF